MPAATNRDAAVRCVYLASGSNLPLFASPLSSPRNTRVITAKSDYVAQPT